MFEWRRDIIPEFRLDCKEARVQWEGQSDTVVTLRVREGGSVDHGSVDRSGPSERRVMAVSA